MSLTNAAVNTVTQGEIAAFIFETGNLNAEVIPLGQFGYSIIQSLEKSKGDLSPFILPHPENRNEFAVVDTVRGAPDLGSATIIEKVDPRVKNFLERLFDQDCGYDALIYLGCDSKKTDPTKFLSVVLVEKMQSTTLGFNTDLMSFTENTAEKVEFTTETSYITWNRIFPVIFASKAGDEILAEVLDVVYADSVSCGACAPYSLGNNKVFALTAANTGSPGLSAQLVYSLDQGSTWSTLDWAVLGGNTARRMTEVGQYLVTVSETDGSHAYIPIDTLTTAAQVRVTSGYQVSGSPRAIYASSVGNVIIVGAGGYIYRATDVTSGVSVVHDATDTTENANDVHGAGNVVVSVHDNDVVMLSTNNGRTFASTTVTPEAGTNLTAVWVVSPTAWYIGTNSGKLWYTTDGGASYTQRRLPQQDSIAAILRINFSDDSSRVGAVSVQYTNNTGAIYRTFSGGIHWLDDTTDAIGDIPANERLNAIAHFGVNELFIGGKQSGSTDGVLAIATID